MATGSIHRFPRRKQDGSIEAERSIKDENGNIQKVSEVIFTADSPTIPVDFTDEINRLIQNGDINIPVASSLNMHIVDITDQLEDDKYTYNFVNKNNQSIATGDIYRIFLNGVNVSEDLTISEDRKSFTFIDLYDGKTFGFPETRLVIDFIEKE